MGVTSDIQKAVSQAFDPAFRSVLFRALALAFVLLVATGTGLVWLLLWFLPDSVGIPWMGDINPDVAASIIAIPLLLLLSAFAMFPVAAIFVGIFLDRIADAVEARHYPHLAPNRDVPLGETLAQGLKMALLILLANIMALVVYGILAPVAPLVYWALNGYLLGREFFTQAAVRRISNADARALRRANRSEVWLLGALIAIPMSFPIVNLVVPLIGAAAFTHLFHRVRQ